MLREQKSSDQTRNSTGSATGKGHTQNAASLVVLALIFVVTQGCGVKGDPVPPGTPAELSRGRPTYRRATEGLKLYKISPDEEEDKKDDEEGEE